MVSKKGSIIQYIPFENGRIRNAKKVNSYTGAVYYAFEYDYFIQDHLGNVRSVLTEGKDTAIYSATMESKDSAVVQALFKDVYDPIRTVCDKPDAFDTDSSNHYVSKLNASSGINSKVGPSIVLKVMAGDQVQISTYSYYNSPVQPPPNGMNLLSDVLGLLAGGVINNSGGKLLVADAPNLSSVLNPNVFNFLSTGRNYDSTRPKAYLNWILFDNQFNYIAGNSGVQQVQPGGQKQVLSAPLQTISRNGYLYIYLSNESPQDVFFDQLTVKHVTGPLQQEQSFYPFGLQIASISDKAILRSNTAYKFNSATELQEDGGLNYYKCFFRDYDPQIGRFSAPDIYSEKGFDQSSYHFSANNPVLYADPRGALDEKYIPGEEERESDNGNTAFDPSNGGSSAGGAESYSDIPVDGFQTDGITSNWNIGNNSSSLSDVMQGSVNLRNGVDNQLRDGEEENSGPCGGPGQNPCTLLPSVVVDGSEVERAKKDQKDWFEQKWHQVDGYNMPVGIEAGLIDAAMKLRNLEEAAPAVSKLTTRIGILGVVVSVVNLAHDAGTGNKHQAAVHTADLVVGVVSVVCKNPYVAAICAGYGVSRIFWGNEE